MFLTISQLCPCAINHQSSVIFLGTFMGKTYLYSLCSKVRIKQHISLESLFTYFIFIVIESSIRKGYIVNYLGKLCIRCKNFTY